MARGLVFVAAVALCCDPLSAPVVVVSPAPSSSCRYFQSLTEALAVPAAPSLHLRFLPTPAGVQLTGETTVTGEVEIYANHTLLVVSGAVAIQGSLTIIEAEMRVFGDVDTPVFMVTGGTLGLQYGKVTNEKRGFIQVLGGNVTIIDYEFQGLEGAIITLQSADFQLSMDQILITNCSSVIEVNFQASRFEGCGQLARVDMSEAGRLLWCGNCELGSFQLRISDSAFLGSYQALISGAVENVRIDVENATFQGIDNLVSGSLHNSSLYIRNSTVSRLKKNYISLSSLSGEISIENTEFTDVEGLVVFLQANVFPPSVAIVSFRNCSFSSLKSLKGTGSLYCCSSVTLVAEDIEVRDIYVATSGLFQVTSGVVHFSRIDYRDSFGYFAALYQVQATELLLVDSVFANLTVNSGYFSICSTSSRCVWRNVSMTEFFDPTPPAILLYTWGGFLGNATVLSSYFRPTQTQSQLSLGAAAHGFLYVSHCVFEDLWNYETFGAYTESTIYLTNITLIRPRLDILFSCEFSPACLFADGITVIGDSHIATLIQANSGIAQVRSASFSGVSYAVIMATNTNISFTNVNVKNFAGVVCRTCANSLVALQSLTLEHAAADVEFEMTYSQLTLRSVLIRDVSCQQLLLLESTELSLTDTVFEGLTVHSFGGVINAASCAITVTGTALMQVSGVLSMYIGLIFLESSSLTIRDSSFSDFNITLIHSVRSPTVEITFSRFYNTESAQSAASVPLRGGVLWSEYTPLVHIANCEFLNLAADFGGVLYLSGTGAEVCEIDNSTAAFNTAKDSGGFLYSDGVNVVIRDCDFVGNSAAKGGALALFRETKNTIKGSLFSRNSALEGGALTFLRTKNNISTCEWVNNSAVYGPDIASEVESLSILNDTFSANSNFSIEAVSGQSYKHPLLIGCLDEYGQIVSTDNGSKLSLFTLEANFSVVASSLLESSSGVYRIPSITVIGTPGSKISVYGTYRLNLTLPLFTVALRDCVPGEYFSGQQCILCTHNTYSFHPSQPCTLCPDQADCPSGALMSLHEGFWRTGNDTDDIYTCLLRELCVGGFTSDCKSGNLGIMCSSCSSDYFKVNQLQCISCGPLSTSVFKAIVSTGISIASTVCCYLRGPKSVQLHLAAFDYMQSLWIMASFNVYWPLPLAYFYVVLGDIGSLGLTAFTGSCFGAAGALSESHSRYLALLVYALALSTALVLIVSYRIWFRSEAQLLHLVLYAYYLVLPVAYYRVLQLLPCIVVSDADYLIVNSKIECWTDSHFTLALAAGLPVYLLTAISLICLATAAVKRNRILPPWKALYLLILLLRKLLLISLLLFSATFALSTQAVLAMAVNILTEAGLYCLERMKSPPGLLFYERSVLASTVLMFAFAIYGPSQFGAVPFTMVVLVVALSPVLVPLCPRLRSPARVAGTPQRNSSMDAIHSSSVELQVSEIEAPSPSLQTPMESSPYASS